MTEDRLDRLLESLGEEPLPAMEESCPRQTEALAFVEATLPSDRAAAVEAHLAECPACRRAAVDYARASAPAVETEARPRRLRLRWLAAAAILVAIGIVFSQLASRSAPSASVALAFDSTRGGTAAAHPGDTFHLEVTPAASGYLYVALLYESDDTCSGLVPLDPKNADPDRLRAGIAYRFPPPSGPENRFVLGDHPGEVSMVCVFSADLLPRGEWSGLLEKLTASNLDRSMRDFLAAHRDASPSVERFEIQR
jgi:hypothetical protein